MSERHFQEALCQWLKGERIPFFWQRMDRASGGQVGHPDFSIFLNGRVLFLEAKFGKGKLSTRQVFRHSELEKAGCRVHVCRTIEHAIALVQEWRQQAPQMQGDAPIPTAPRRRIGGHIVELRGGQWITVGRVKPGDELLPTLTR